MYLELDEKEYELMKEVSEITITNYELKGNLISTDSILAAIQDLVWEVHRLEDEKQEIIDDRNDNWKPIDYKDQYEVYDRDFI